MALLRMPSPKRLLGGVCAGLAYELGLPAWFIRALTVTFSVGFPYLVPPAYLIGCFALKAAKRVPKDYEAKTKLKL